jgi:DNA-binding NtrC family response regulator
MASSKLLSTKLVEGKDAKLVLDKAELRVTAGPDRGLELELGADSLLIGSSPRCDVVLHDGTVSARHAEIQASARGYAIRDLGSTNGILLGNHKIERAPLQDGMRLELGDSVLVVRALGGTRSVPLSRAGLFGELVAHSIKMRAFVEQLAQAARSSATVLLEGESGAGKEVAAQALHRASPRKNAPLVVFDCGAQAGSLAAAELFGHEKGAFTGARESRPGLVEEAEGGTLFLDEIGELPLELQPLLLGLLERKRSRRIGGREELRHDVRIIAATNRNLAEEVRAKRLREDLFHRLAVLRLRVPPLRERPEDLPVLADTYAAEAGGSLSADALAPLLAYDWPGNVRQLRNVVTRMIVQGEKPSAALAHDRRPGALALFDEQGRLRPWLDVRQDATAAAERIYVECALKSCGNSLTQAAELAGITRQSFTALAVKHGLHPRDH